MIYDDLISVENILRCWLEFKKGKNEKKDLVLFERYLEDNIFALHEQLKTNSYHHDSYKRFHIYDPKFRTISKATVKDRLVHHIVFNELNRIFDPVFVYHSYSSRKNKGTHLAINNLSSILRKSSKNYTINTYALKCDVKKFFDNINHDILISLIQERIKDNQFMNLTKEIIQNFDCGRVGKGIPIGNVTSQIFANIYLNELDQFMKHKLKIKYYFRYADDFLIISQDKDFLLSLLNQVRDFLKENLLIEVHPNKVEIRKFKQGIDFLGYVVLPHHINLRTKTKKRMFKKLSNNKNLLKSNKIDYFSFSQGIQSYLGMLKHANAYDLRCFIINYYLGCGLIYN
jgi:retron-type reverse transcriptase